LSLSVALLVAPLDKPLGLLVFSVLPAALCLLRSLSLCALGLFAVLLLLSDAALLFPFELLGLDPSSLLVLAALPAAVCLPLGLPLGALGFLTVLLGLALGGLALLLFFAQALHFELL